MDRELVELMTQIDASVYVIDCLPNMPASKVAKRAEPLVKLLREKQWITNTSVKLP